MKKHFKNIALAALALATVPAVLPSCENDYFLYRDQPRIRLVGQSVWTLGTDSLLFNFVTYPDSVRSYDMTVNAWLMGVVSDRDRTFSLAVDPELTTASPSQYAMPAEVVLPAGQNHVAFTVTFNRDETLQQATARLYVKVAASADFLPGDVEEDHILLKWNDILAKPTNWSDLEPYFGEYSDVKYRFMINNADGLTSFDVVSLTIAELKSLRIKFAKALDEYNATHDEMLKDENGVPISF